MKLAVIMDPIERINPKKDSTLAMMLEAQRRGHTLHYITSDGLYCRGGEARCEFHHIAVHDATDRWFELGERGEIALGEMDVILMRKDPPFDMEYIMDTYLLDLAESQGARVVNAPQALRDANEKFFTQLFPEVTAEAVVSRNPEHLKAAVHTYSEAVIKPMDGMGGASIFKLSAQDKNLNVILETVTQMGTRTAMVQRYIKEISAGDKRILMIHGEPVPYALARIPAADDFRGNLARGGRGEGVALSAADRAICEAVGPELKARNILFAGLDVIGSSLTEINVTSPTCIRELDRLYNLNIAGILFDQLEQNYL